jgi:ribosomal protein L16 Arg81 hydroxylase
MLDLEWLLSPFDKGRFFDEVWQKKPEVIATARHGHLTGLFDKEALERVLEYSQPKPPSVRLASAASEQGAEVPFSPNGRINMDRLRKLYLEGYTVILNSVEDFDPAVSRLARSIETEMGARVQVNCYLTPASAQGFNRHYDTHDVLVAQVEGEKLWKVYGRDAACPLNELIDGDPRLAEVVHPPEEIRLAPGDILYIPRGWVHEAITDRAASLHLTLGLHPPVGKDLLMAALEALVGSHPELREALPIGPLDTPARRQSLETRFARLVELFASHASAAEAARAIDDQMLRRGRSGGDGHLFQDVEALGGLTAHSLLERRTDLPCRVVEMDDGIGLQFLNGLIKGPAAFKAAMDFLATCDEPFTPADLPGLPAEHQLVFASSLVSDGLCRLRARNGASLSHRPRSSRAEVVAGVNPNAGSPEAVWAESALRH